MSALPSERPVAVLSAQPRRRRSVALRGSTALGAGVALLVFLLLFAVIGGLLLVDPTEQNLSDTLVPPGTSGHLLGTDPLGRDLLSWVAGGLKVAVLISGSVVLLSAVVGVAIGTLAGYFGGFLDAVLMRLVDLQLAIPPLLLFIAASATISGGAVSMVLLISSVAWVPYARLVRTKVLSERERSYIAAARLAGAPRRRIVVRHLMRSSVSVVAILGSLQFGYVTLWESGLSFLGLGIQPPSTSLGFMIAQGRDHLDDAWWIALFPGVGLALIVVASGLIGDGLRDVLGQGDGDAK